MLDGKRMSAFTRVNPSMRLARHWGKSLPFEGNATISATGFPPRMAEKRTLVPPASNVMTMRESESRCMVSRQL